ncbi:MAG: metallophosphoesterase [Buchananella hordeovulneris]|nr:metallophosphoesterase [Buchananella hordeovulneris]
MAWRKALVGTALLGVGTLAYSLWEARQYVVRHVEIPAPRPEAAGMRILQVADVHLLPGDRARVEFVRSLVELEPGLVVSTGDNLSAAAALPELLEAYAPLLDLPGVFVFGSNDYYAPVPKSPLQYVRKALGWQELQAEMEEDRPLLPSEDLREAFVAAGWLEANNATGSVQAAGRRVSVLGLDDPHIGRDALPPVSGAVLGDDVAALRLGVVHAPYARALSALTGAGCELLLAGHTHGGQICLPGVGALVTNCDLPRQVASGLSWWGGQDAQAVTEGSQEAGRRGAWLHVDAGIGTAPHTPIRLACRPGATLINLV